MTDPSFAILDHLSTAFARIADRAEWMRAVFTLTEGRFGIFYLGRKGEDGLDKPLIENLPGQREIPFITELHSLTDQAGAFTSNLIRSGRYSWVPWANGPLIFDSKDQKHFFWLFFLLHTPPVMMNCRGKHADGISFVAMPEVGESKLVVWIDNYAEVCVSGLALVKAALLGDPLKTPNLSAPPPTSSTALAESHQIIPNLIDTAPVDVIPTPSNTAAMQQASSAIEQQSEESLHSIPFRSPLCVSDYARLLRDLGYTRATDNAVDAFLRSYRSKHDDCHIEVERDDRRRNTPKFLYPLPSRGMALACYAFPWLTPMTDDRRTTRLHFLKTLHI